MLFVTLIVSAAGFIYCGIRFLQLASASPPFMGPMARALSYAASALEISFGVYCGAAAIGLAPPAPYGVHAVAAVIFLALTQPMRLLLRRHLQRSPDQPP
jgi:hypothetical protein